MPAGIGVQECSQAALEESNRLAMWAELQSPDPRIDWNHGNGKCLGTSVRRMKGGKESSDCEYMSPNLYGLEFFI